ncbi:uncharacterized protein LOC135400075 isoform X2 [Ornithodoros turicata]|uniref:uncharacterized protein LOC135400075 isoform X2 n=1 Tax=Ornithodoros turicata TaxID=34597 RepID=UPI003138EA2D
MSGEDIEVAPDVVSEAPLESTDTNYGKFKFTLSYLCLACCTWLLPCVIFGIFVIISYSLIDESKLFLFTDSTPQASTMHVTWGEDSPCRIHAFLAPCRDREPHMRENQFFFQSFGNCEKYDNLPLGCLPFPLTAPYPPRNLAECKTMCEGAIVSQICHTGWNVRPCRRSDVTEVSFFYDAYFRACVESPVIDAECVAVLQPVPDSFKIRKAFYNPFTRRCEEFRKEHLCLEGDNQFHSVQNCTNTCRRYRP